MAHIACLMSAALIHLLLIFSSQAIASRALPLFNNLCRTCHSLKPRDHRLGPSLAQIYGRVSGSAPGYSYTEAMRTAGITWNETTLDIFLAEPDNLIHGHGMNPYGGIKSETDRSAIIQLLKAHSRN
ncbi:c-type cytochrome [Chthonobacter rhizosphaerae]|uniref:c-type cytochrome n=1 Tax=Chthonobacter rhizosphaerae TaxID=2735553 RepID=UPI0031B61F27